MEIWCGLENGRAIGTEAQVSRAFNQKVPSSKLEVGTPFVEAAASSRATLLSKAASVYMQALGHFCKDYGIDLGPSIELRCETRGSVGIQGWSQYTTTPITHRVPQFPLSRLSSLQHLEWRQRIVTYSLMWAIYPCPSYVFIILQSTTTQSLASPQQTLQHPAR